MWLLCTYKSARGRSGGCGYYSMDDEQEALLKEQPAEGDGKGAGRKCGAAMLRQLAATGCLAGVIISCEC